MPTPIDLNSSLPFGPKHIPGFLGDGISTVVKMLDKTDFLDDDGLVAAVPFGKLVVFGYKKLRNFTGASAAIRRSVGTAVGICFGAGLADYGISTLSLTADEEKRFKNSLKTAFKEANLDLGKFNPERLADTDIAQNFFGKYLAAFDRSGVDEGKKVENRIRPHLETYLREWLPVVYAAILEKDPERYAVIGKTMRGKSRQLATEVLALKTYHQRLFSFYTTPAGNISNIPLSTLYLRARTQVQTMLLKSKDRHDPTAKKFTPAEEADLPNDLHDLVMAWLGLADHPLNCEKLRTEADPRLLLLYGQPGQGKTSFCKRLLYDLISTRVHYDRPVYFLRLRDIKDVSGLREDPLDHLRQEIEAVNDLAIEAADFQRSILVLDGMDELAMSNGMTIDSADRLLSGIEDQLKHHPELRIIVTSRHGYLRADDRLHKDFLVLQIADLNRNQQEEWLALYEQETGKTTLTAETLKNIDKNSSLGKLLTQPLLLQLVADLDKLPEDTAARAGVYDHIFNHLIETPWKSGQIKTLENLTDREVQEDFRQALREIAFELFVRGVEALPGKVVNELESVTYLSKQLGRDEAEDGLRLMQVAFYFQEKLDRDTGQYAIEFQHKSFGEYLAAEYFYEEVLFRFLQKGDRGRGYRYTGAAALAEWHKLASRRPFTLEMIDYLIEIIQRDDENRIELRTELKDRFLYLAGDWFAAGFIDPFDTKPDYADPVTERGLMSGYLWFTLASWLDDRAVLTQDSTYRKAAIRIISLFANEKIYWRLEKAFLSGADLSLVDFGQVNLSDANLSKSIFYGSYLLGSNMSNANLKGADFNNACLSHTNLSGADLSNAVLDGADLSYAHLNGTVLNEAYLAGADLSHVTISHPRIFLTAHKMSEKTATPLTCYIQRYRACLFSVFGCRNDFDLSNFQDNNEWDEEKGKWADWWIKECEAIREEE